MTYVHVLRRRLGNFQLWLCASEREADTHREGGERGRRDQEGRMERGERRAEREGEGIRALRRRSCRAAADGGGLI